MTLVPEQTQPETPRNVVQLRFAQDFTPVGMEEALVDPIETGSFLAVLHRIHAGIGQTLKAGSPRGAYAWQAGAGYALQYGQTEHAYRFVDGVTLWEELLPDWAPPHPLPLHQACPLFPQQSEILTMLEDETTVSWVGMRDHATDSWENFSREDIDSADFRQVTLSLLQAEATLRNQAYPRGRTCLHYESGSLWIFSNSSSDYLLVFSDGEDPATLWRIRQAGEAFLLT